MVHQPQQMGDWLEEAESLFELRELKEALKQEEMKEAPSTDEISRLKNDIEALCPDDSRNALLCAIDLTEPQYEFTKSWLLPIIDVQEKELVRVKQEYKNIEIKLDYKETEPAFWKIYQQEDLRERHLELANLRGASLYNADFRGTFLKNANLIALKMQGADLSEAQLQGADLRWAQLFAIKNHSDLIDTFGQYLSSQDGWGDVENWDSLIIAVSQLQGAEENTRMQSNVNSALKRLKGAKTWAISAEAIKSAKKLASQQSKLDPELQLARVHEIRRKLACENKWVAERFMRIEPNNVIHDAQLENHIKTDPLCIKNKIAEFVLDNS